GALRCEGRDSWTGGAPDAGVVRVGEAVREYLQYLEVERGLAANTVESYRRDLRRYAELLTARGKGALGDVRSTDVAEFVAALRAGDDAPPPLAVDSAGRAGGAGRRRHACAVARGGGAGAPARQGAPR